MAGRAQWPRSAIGRLLEIANGCFVQAKHEYPLAERRAALEKLDGRVWVESTNSLAGRAVVQHELRLYGGLPLNCRPILSDWSMADYVDASIMRNDVCGYAPNADMLGMTRF
jgi:hypothetical protein